MKDIVLIKLKMNVTCDESKNIYKKGQLLIAFELDNTYQLCNMEGEVIQKPYAKKIGVMELKKEN